MPLAQHRAATRQKQMEGKEDYPANTYECPEPGKATQEQRAFPFAWAVNLVFGTWWSGVMCKG